MYGPYFGCAIRISDKAHKNSNSSATPATDYKSDMFDNNKDGYVKFSGQRNGNKFRV